MQQLKTQPVDQLAALFNRMGERITALERAAKIGMALSELDDRYVNVTGDVMTGDLTISSPSALFLGSATDRQQINLYSTTYGLGVQSGTEYFRSGSSWSWHRGGVHSSVANDPGAGGTEQMRLSSNRLDLLATTFNMYGSAGNAPFIQAFDGSSIAVPGTRKGYMGWASTLHFYINNEVATGNIYLYPGASAVLIMGIGTTEKVRLDGGGVLNVGRTTNSAYYTDAGIDLRPSGQFLATNEAVNTFPWLVRIGAALAAGQRFLSLRTATSGTGTEIGSITMATTTSCAFNTTSHGPFKGNVTDLDDDEAIARIMRWRPVAFQWKLDADGNLDENGQPSGEVQHGFIAQEMNEVNPSAVTPGMGTWDEHLAWRELHRVWQSASKLHADWLGADESKRGPEPEVPDDPGDSPFLAWMGDWTHLVPDLAAAVQAIVRQNVALAARVEALEAA